MKRAALEELRTLAKLPKFTERLPTRDEGRLVFEAIAELSWTGGRANIEARWFVMHNNAKGMGLHQATQEGLDRFNELREAILEWNDGIGDWPEPRT